MLNKRGIAPLVIVIIVVAVAIGGVAFLSKNIQPSPAGDDSGADEGSGPTFQYRQSRIIWQFQANPSWILDVEAIGDIDGDSIDEIAVGTYNAHNYVNIVYLISGKEGNLLWSYTPQSTGISKLAALKDINNDNFEDIAAVVQGGPNMAEFQVLSGANGSLVWSYVTNYNSAYDVEAISDINNDGINDVIGSTSGLPPDPDNRVLLLDGVTGELIWDYSLSVLGFNSKDVEAIQDVDGDGIADVLFGTLGSSCPGPQSEHIFVVSGRNGTLIWSRGPNFGVAVESISSIKGVGEDVISAAQCEVSWGESRVYRLRREDGAVIWQFETTQCPNANEFLSVKVIRDINDDGVDDVITQQERGGLTSCAGIYAIDGMSGGQIWRRVGINGIGGWDSAVSTVMDINGDGITDVLVPAEIGPLEEQGTLYALEGDTGHLLWSFDSNTKITASVGISDINGNGIPDVITTDGNGIVYALEGSPSF